MNVEKTLKKKPPETPSQVFLGETIAEKGVLPINAPISLLEKKSQRQNLPRKRHPLSVCQAATNQKIIKLILSLFIL